MKHLFVFATLIQFLQAALALERDFFETTIIPSDILIALDESIYIKLKNPIESQTECSYISPGKKEINSPDTLVEFSDDKCGIRIEKVKISHAGVWKLISTFKNSTYESSVKGASVVRVKKRAIITKQENRVNSEADDFAPNGVNLSYCYVTRTVGLSKMFELDPIKCMMPQKLHSDYRDGEWNVKMGIDGESKEVSFSVNIQPSDETIETIVKRPDNEHIQLLCRVKNLKNVLKFCRFERVGDDDFGLNLDDGIASDNYRFYGQGLGYGDCGLEIKNMKAYDKAQWKCFVGLMDSDDASKGIPNPRIYKHSAVLDASDDWNKLKIIKDVPELLFVDNQSAIIECHANNPFDYCWFQNPAGKLLSISDLKPKSEDDEFQYYGDGFHLGHCGIRIKKIFFSDAGDWRCGMGRATDSMKEAVKIIKIDVKATSMVAIKKQVKDFSRNLAVVECRAIPIGSSLASCHFLTPTGEAFSINEKVTEATAIDDTFYFNPNRKLSEGYCTVIIKLLNRDKHAGEWICSGRIIGHDEESYDTVYVMVDGLRGASLSYLSLAIVLPLLVVSALATFGYQKWKQRQQVSNERLDEISMHTISSNGTEVTESSETSAATSHSA